MPIYVCVCVHNTYICIYIHAYAYIYTHEYVYIYIYIYEYINRASQVALMVKNTSAIAGGVRDTGSIHGSGIYPRGGRVQQTPPVYILFVYI